MYLDSVVLGHYNLLVDNSVRLGGRAFSAHMCLYSILNQFYFHGQKRAVLYMHFLSFNRLIKSKFVFPNPQGNGETWMSHSAESRQKLAESKSRAASTVILRSTELY